MNFLKKLFGLIPPEEEQKAEIPAGALRLWEDDYLMIELLPKENLKFVEEETKRIDAFAKEHALDQGFGAITPIGEKQVRTLDKMIDINSVHETFEETGLPEIEYFVTQEGALVENDGILFGFGSSTFALLYEARNGLLCNMWVTGRPKDSYDKQLMLHPLHTLGQIYDLFIVNWYNSTYYDLADKDATEEFIDTI